MAWVENNSGTNIGTVYTGVMAGYKITPTAGTCTQLRMYLWDEGSHVNCKLALYKRTAARTYALQGYCNTATATTSVEGAAMDINLDRDASGGTVSGITVTAVEYWVFVKQSGTAKKYQGTAVSDSAYQDETYADAWPVTREYMNEDSDENIRVGMNITAGGGAKATKNTRSFPLGIAAGMNRRM